MSQERSASLAEVREKYGPEFKAHAQAGRKALADTRREENHRAGDKKAVSEVGAGTWTRRPVCGRLEHRGRSLPASRRNVARLKRRASQGLDPLRKSRRKCLGVDRPGNPQ